MWKRSTSLVKRQTTIAKKKNRKKQAENWGNMLLDVQTLVQNMFGSLRDQRIVQTTANALIRHLQTTLVD